MDDDCSLTVRSRPSFSPSDRSSNPSRPSTRLAKGFWDQNPVAAVSATKLVVGSRVRGFGLTIRFHSGNRVRGIAPEEPGVGCDERLGRGDWGLYSEKSSIAKRYVSDKAGSLLDTSALVSDTRGPDSLSQDLPAAFSNLRATSFPNITRCHASQTPQDTCCIVFRSHDIEASETPFHRGCDKDGRRREICVMKRERIEECCCGLESASVAIPYEPRMTLTAILLTPQPIQSSLAFPFIVLSRSAPSSGLTLSVAM